MGHTRRRAKSVARNFSAEMEAYLAGDDAALTDNALWQILIAEPYFTAGGLEESMSAAERLRFAGLQAEQARRRSASELVHYRALASKNGFLQRWEDYLARNVPPDFAFAYAQSEFFREYGRASIANPQGLPN